MSPILLRSSLRDLLRHPWQVGLSILGVALGVAVVVSVDLANGSARRAFALFTESVAGRATHQVVGGPTGLPEEVYRTLRVEAGVRLAAPVVEGDVAVRDDSGRVFHLLGLDPFAEGPFRPYLRRIDKQASADLSALLTEPATVLFSGETARQLGLEAGDTFEIDVGGRRQTVSLAGVLQPGGEASLRALESLLVSDIASAQELLAMPGRLSRIDLLVPDGPEGQALLARIRGALPPGAQVIRAASRSETLEQMTRAFSINLTALSLLALVVGMFLIYNTMSFSVIRRRALIGTLRALGVTRGEVFLLVLGDALLIGLVGTAAGALLGILLGRGLVHLVTQTINDLYFVLSVRELDISPFTLLKGGGLGLGATLLAALMPAFEATAAPPRAVLSRSVIEARRRGAVPRAALSGMILGLAGAGVLFLPSKSLPQSYAALFAIILGFALLTPAALVLSMSLLQPLLGRFLGILGRMAARNVVATLSRTAIALAALMVAVSTTVGVGIMIGSFRGTVSRWLDTSLRADIYVAPASLAGSHIHSTLDPALVERLASAPAVAHVSTYRGALIDSPHGVTHIVALGIEPGSYSAFRFKEGVPAAVWPGFQDGQAVIVSEPYAYRHDLQVGSTLRLPTDRGTREFPVLGVFYDYGSDQGVVMMSRRTYDRLWDDPGISSLGIYAAPGSDVDQLVESLRRRVGSEQEVFIRSNRALREVSLEVFDRTFAITAVLRLLATVVAFIGVLSALMALQLERARELGVLRASGLTPRQVWGLVTSETGLMGFVAGLTAIPVGIVLALVLIFVINRRSFGWTLEVQIDPGMLIQALLLALVAAILAGVYPALRMSRSSPALALREE